jgi:hypothetical protein
VSELPGLDLVSRILHIKRECNRNQKVKQKPAPILSNPEIKRREKHNGMQRNCETQHVSALNQADEQYVDKPKHSNRNRLKQQQNGCEQRGKTNHMSGMNQPKIRYTSGRLPKPTKQFVVQKLLLHCFARPLSMWNYKFGPIRIELMNQQNMHNQKTSTKSSTWEISRQQITYCKSYKEKTSFKAHQTPENNRNQQQNGLLYFEENQRRQNQTEKQ